MVDRRGLLLHIAVPGAWSPIFGSTPNDYGPSFHLPWMDKGTTTSYEDAVVSVSKLEEWCGGGPDLLGRGEIKTEGFPFPPGWRVGFEKLSKEREWGGLVKPALAEEFELASEVA